VPELARQVLGAGFVVDVEATAAPGRDLAERLGSISGVMTVTRIGDKNYRMTADHDVRAEAARVVVHADGALTHLAVADPSLDAIYSGFFARQDKPKEMRDAA
jgi:ABC-2 type transport system ATP-binding protein